MSNSTTSNTEIENLLTCCGCDAEITPADADNYQGRCEDCYGAEFHPNLTEPPTGEYIGSNGYESNGDSGMEDNGDLISLEDYVPEPDDDAESVVSDGGIDRCCICYEPSEFITTCGHTICNGCFPSISSHHIYRQGLSTRVRPCPVCRAELPDVLIERPLTDSQKVRRYETLMAENARLGDETTAQNVVIGNLRMNLAQARLNTTAPITLIAGTETAIAQPTRTPRVARNNHTRVHIHRTPQVITTETTGTDLLARPARLADQVNLTGTQVLGDITFDNRPRRRCSRNPAGYNDEGGINLPCRSNTRRVCSTCRNVRVCARCAVCNTCSAL